jgi:PucR-like helix-turn-helix protein
VQVPGSGTGGKIISVNAHLPVDDGESDGDLRRVLGRFDVGVVERRMETGIRQLPAYSRFFWPVDRGAMVRWNVDLTLRWMMNGTPPEEYVLSDLQELLQARATAGQPLDDSVLVYRRGARMFWEALLDLATEEDRSLLTAQADTVWGYLEEYVDMVVRVFAQAHPDQEDSPSVVGDSRARALFDRLCAQVPLTAEDRDRTARLGFDLAAPACPFTAQLAGASVADHANLAARLRTARALAFTEGIRVTGLMSPGFSWRTFLADPRLVFAQDPSTPRARLGAAAESLRALTAIAARCEYRGRVSAEDFLPELLVADSPDVADRIVWRVFGRLERADPMDLAGTLRCLAAHAFDSAATAAALSLDANTLLYRISRIEKLTALSLGEHRHRTLVLLAVTWETISRDQRAGS